MQRYSSMNSYFAFGERISSFLLRDAAHLNLQISHTKETKASYISPAPNQSSATTETWKSRAIKHARLVEKGCTLSKLKDAAVTEKPKQIQVPETQSYFRLSDLPPEVRDMTFAYAFKRTCGKAPKLLHALKGNATLWESAMKVYCKVNNFSISLRNNSKKKGVEIMTNEYLKLVRNLTIVVPNEVQQSVFFTSCVVHSSIQHLTLQVTTEKGLRVAACSIIPKFPQIETMTVVIKNAKDRRRRDGLLLYRAVYLNSYYEAITTINKILGVEGKSIESQGKRQKKIWVWEAERDDKIGKRFKMTVVKNHVKFD